MAFGTGLHPSTQLCLLALDGVVGPGLRVLDAGCGSGMMSLAAAQLSTARVDALDIDPIAVRATEENISYNVLPVPINVVTSAGPNPSGPRWMPVEGARPAWDIMLVNILPHVIMALLDQGLSGYLAPGGHMILAGIIEEREAELCATLAERGFSVVRRLSQGDWVSLVIRLRSSRSV